MSTFLFNKINRQDLIRLARHLNKLPETYKHFSMGAYFRNDSLSDLSDNEFNELYPNCQGYYEYELPCHVTEERVNECGTVACAIGHAPSIKGMWVKPVPDESYHAYSLRFLLGEHDDSDTRFHWRYKGDVSVSTIWNFLFAEEWSKIDNTAKGAAKRLYFLVTATEEQFNALLKQDALLEHHDFKVWFELYKNIEVQ